MSKNAKKRYKVKRIYTPEELAEWTVLKSTHSQWSRLANERGDIRVIAKHCHVSKTIVSRIIKHNSGSLDSMRCVARYLINRQMKDAKVSQEILSGL